MFTILAILAGIFIAYVLIVDNIIKKKNQEEKDAFMAMQMQQKVLNELEEKKEGKKEKKEEKPKDKKEKPQEIKEEKPKESVKEEVKESVKEKVKENVNKKEEKSKPNNKYIRPSVALLDKVIHKEENPELINKNMEAIRNVLTNNNVNAKMGEVSLGTVYSVYEIESSNNTDKIISLEKEFASSLGLKKINFLNPVPNKDAVGIIIPNKKIDKVSLKEMLSNVPSEQKKKELLIPLGACPYNKLYTSMYESHHLLVTGINSTDTLTFINDVIVSSLIRMTPSELGLVIIDGKENELNNYTKLPHILNKVMTNKATKTLNNLVELIESRYKLLNGNDCKSIMVYNERPNVEKLPHVLVVINGYDAIYQKNPETLDVINEIVSKGRKAGVHILLNIDNNTNESIDLINKLDIPSVVMFKSNKNLKYKGLSDNGVLTGHGEAFVKIINDNNTYRLQVPFVSDKDIKQILDFINEKKNN